MDHATPLANPFREGLGRATAPGPCCFVLFGATGDLCARKLLPALYNLAREGLTPAEFYVLGVSRKPQSDLQWRTAMQQAVAKYSRHQPLDPAVWEAFAQRLGYQACEFGNPAQYADLRVRLDDIDRRWGTAGNRLFYLAVAPEFFASIPSQLGAVGLLGESGGRWTRVVVEKPFGTDLTSAEALSTHLRGLLRERQIYRIDHYLGKETVQNILTLRFGNAIFEPLWDRRYIEAVQITVAETVGMEGRRGPFYERAGALRDMVQNHMMQLLSLVAMEPPAAWHAEAIRDEKAKVLQALAPLSAEQVATQVVRGQYTRGYLLGEEALGYREEDGVAADSATETFVALRTELRTWRWSGVPFYLRHGKRLPKRASEIAVTFRQPPLALFQNPDDPSGNTLVLRLQPDEGLSLSFLSKVPGMRLQRRQVKMDFNYGSAFGTASPEAYERLILDALIGDSTLFTRDDEVQYAWRFVSSLLDGLAAQGPAGMTTYEAGTWGPPAADRLLLADHAWRRL
ncbi:MAG: glucose-6-phosphate dehydrogenase [Fimbriimonadaceae bacterium]|nr:glucose-6-phosphate dehydrogenase [Fimbriimonadaceae bacterium]